jgi:hypothetical protein
MLLAGVVSAAPPAPTNRPDANGWSKAKWGMTDSQVLAAFPGEARKEESGSGTEGLVGLASIPKTRIGEHDFEVTFFFVSKSRTLQEVHLDWRVDLYSNTKSGSELPPSASDFDDLEQLLIQKYGKPASKHVENPKPHDLEKKASWVLPSTTIVLDYFEIVSPGYVHALSIHYKRNAGSKTLDKL